MLHAAALVVLIGLAQIFQPSAPGADTSTGQGAELERVFSTKMIGKHDCPNQVDVL